MQAIVYHGTRDFRFEQVPDPVRQEDTDVVVRVERTAICGSDLHIWHGDPLPATGFAMGHEFLGTIEDVGPGVQQHQRGDREAEVARLMEEIELRYKRQYRNDRKSGKRTSAAIPMDAPADELHELAYHRLEAEGKIMEQNGEYIFKIHPEYWKI